MSQSSGPETRAIPPASSREDDTRVLPAEQPTQAVPVSPDEDRTRALPAVSDADRTQAMPAMSDADRTQAMPAMSDADRTQAMPAMSDADRTQAMPATRATPPPARPDRVSALPPVEATRVAGPPTPEPTAAYPPTPPGPAQPAPGPAPQAAQPERRGGTSALAVLALLAALVGLVVPLVSILAIVLGGIALDRIRRRGLGGRGMAKTGVVLGTIELIFTAVVVIGGLLLWNAYGDDIQQGLDQVDELSQTDLTVPELLTGSLGDLSFDDLGELGSALGDADQLQELGGQCQAGDPAACDDLLERVPDGLLPEDVQQYLPQG